ncbi:transposase [Thermoplasma sp. Kam2015]|uniref:RNA-guided endonuclease InsQ/TnpB family protein n=1 Tax=Thermoplasma sp. Kam2015 TaxID=2094122 RepID=UPI000D82C668|nr:RNA-guided endonuclease TnpB family protein [Thermoplasma sp. Kam2015]PYB68193.1 transposase [Thermoplasma sp. Kam2015]
MITATKVKLYPNEGQKILLEKHFGSCRFVYNYFLKRRDEYYITHRDAQRSSLNYFDTNNMLIELKKEYPWLYEINAQSLQMSLRFLDNAFKNFFHKNAEHPRFRKKERNEFFAVPQHIKIQGNRIYFPKFSEGIYFKGSKDKLSEIRDINEIIITKDSGYYYCSIIYENEEELPEKKPLSEENSVGIDLGIEKFATLSNGIAIENPGFIKKVEKRIRRLQKQLSRKQNGSKNRSKHILKLQKEYMKLRNMREDFDDKISTAIAKQYDTIVIEDLNVHGMMQNHHISKSLSDVSFYSFKQKLEWKAEKYGKNIIEIGRFDPSSKICSRCGNVKHDLKLSDRIYHCNVCGLTIDRDLNAAKNIRKIGLIKVGSVRSEFTPVEIATSGLYGIYPYRQRSVVESGSSDASAEE